MAIRRTLWIVGLLLGIVALADIAGISPVGTAAADPTWTCSDEWCIPPVVPVWCFPPYEMHGVATYPRFYLEFV